MHRALLGLRDAFGLPQGLRAWEDKGQCLVILEGNPSHPL